MSFIQEISINGFKSIKTLKEFKLRPLNVLVGLNGTGKSNLISFFKMINELVDQRLQVWTAKQGDADRVLTFGSKETEELSFAIRFTSSSGYTNGYDATLQPTASGGFVFTKENLFFDGPFYGVTRPNLGDGHKESQLQLEKRTGTSQTIASFCYEAISSWTSYHFHDTSETSGVKRACSLHDNEYLRPDASNLAAYLYKLKEEQGAIYDQVCQIIQLCIPFFDDFVLNPQMLPTEEERIRLLWRQKESDYSLWPSQLSDGSLRFICLVSALVQPTPPPVIIIDEPELGLHPYAITLLASLLKSASAESQIIIATQSVQLIDEFSIDDLVVVEKSDGLSVFNRYDEGKFQSWLCEYSLGEIWEKNILSGGSANE